MAAPQHRADPLDHAGRWTEDDFFALPTDQRVELVDGTLVVSPFSGHRHQWIAFGLCAALNAAAPPGVRALGPVNVRLRHERILIPDVAVVRGPIRSTVASDPADVLLVIEIVSAGNAVMDRVFKPELYAEAGIERFLRVELGGERPVGHLFALQDGRYVDAGAGPAVNLDRPFPVVLDLLAMDADDDA